MLSMLPESRHCLGAVAGYRSTILRSTINGNYTDHPALQGIRASETIGGHRSSGGRRPVMILSNDSMMASQDCEPSVAVASHQPPGVSIFESQDCETYSRSQDLAEQARLRKSRYVERHELVRLEQAVNKMQSQLGEMIRPQAAQEPAKQSAEQAVSQIQHLAETLDVEVTNPVPRV